MSLDEDDLCRNDMAFCVTSDALLVCTGALRFWNSLVTTTACVFLLRVWFSFNVGFRRKKRTLVSWFFFFFFRDCRKATISVFNWAKGVPTCLDLLLTQFLLLYAVSIFLYFVLLKDRFGWWRGFRQDQGQCTGNRASWKLRARLSFLVCRNGWVRRRTLGVIGWRFCVLELVIDGLEPASALCENSTVESKQLML